MKDIVFEKKFNVHSYDSDTRGRLSMTSLFNYLQDTASTHASILHFGKEDLEKQSRFWVLARILCKIPVLPLWDDTLTIRTWPRGIDKIFAIRDFEIYSGTEEKIGEASSCWIIVDSTTKRPQRPDSLEDLISTDLARPDLAIELPTKLAPFNSSAYRSPSYKIKHSDLDVNMHVNNAKYIQWTLDSYPLEYILKNQAVAVEVNYLAETLAGDEVLITAEEIEDSFYHSVINSRTGKEHTRIRIEWQTCDDTKVY